MIRHSFFLRNLFLLGTLCISACSPLFPSTPQGTDLPGDGTQTGSSSRVPSAPPPTSTKVPIPTLEVDLAALNGVRIQVWHAFSGASELIFIEKMGLFNTTNEWNITIDAVRQGDAVSLFEAVTTALESGTQPELAAALPEAILTWDALDAVVDLTPYLNDPVWGMSAEDIDDIPQVFWQQDELNGRRLGMPAERSASFLFYNLTWAGELGFDDPPSTAEDLRTQACAANATFRADDLEQNDGYGGWIVDARWMSILPWMQAFGGGVMEDGEYRFETEPNQEALEFLKTLRDDGCSWMTADPDNPYALDQEPHYAQFARHSALFITADMSEAEAFATALTMAASTDEWTMIPFPGTEGTAITAYGPSYAAFQTSPERQLAAWLFMRWLLTPDNQADWVRSTGTFPLRSSAIDLLGAYGAAHPQWLAAVKSLETAGTVPQAASWRTVRFVLEDGTLSIFRLNLPLAEIQGVLTEMDNTARELSGAE